MLLAFTTMLCAAVLHLMIGSAARNECNVFLVVKVVGFQLSNRYTLLEDYGSKEDKSMACAGKDIVERLVPLQCFITCNLVCLAHEVSTTRIRQG